VSFGRAWALAPSQSVARKRRKKENLLIAQETSYVSWALISAPIVVRRPRSRSPCHCPCRPLCCRCRLMLGIRGSSLAVLVLGSALSLGGAGAGVGGGLLAPIHPASNSSQGWRWVPRSGLAQLGWGVGSSVSAPVAKTTKHIIWARVTHEVARVL
jgi:hypothetical protein